MRPFGNQRSTAITTPANRQRTANSANGLRAAARKVTTGASLSQGDLPC